MPAETTYKCDQCGKTKGEANHWWKSIVITSTGPRHNFLQMMPWSTQIHALEGDTMRFLCGNACAQRELEQFLQKGGLE